MITEQDRAEFLQWAKNTGRAEYKLTDIAKSKDGKYVFEKQMAWVINTTPDDWKEFCKDTGRICDEGTFYLFYK